MSLNGCLISRMCRVGRQNFNNAEFQISLFSGF